MQLCVYVGSGTAIEVAQRERCAPDNADPCRLAGRTELCNDRVDAADEIVAVKLISGH